MNQVFTNPVSSALPDKNGRAVPFDFADVMNMIVGERVILVHILGAGTITCKDDGRPAKMIEQRALNGDFLSVQVEADGIVTTRCEPAVDDRTILRAAKAQHCIGRVEIIPCVL